MPSRGYSQLTEQQKIDAFMRWHASLSPAQKNAFNAAYGPNRLNAR